ncbi:MAG TPA: hypothetical protein VM598_12190, partial [Bdellovibrionota bacterium]|nr:hypothetical protein [Bdellovibrionota bacterium]
MVRTIASYAEGYPMLVEDGIPVVTTHLDRSDPAEFILMDNDPREFTYAEYLKIRKSLPEARRRVIDAEFVEFAVASWRYKAFGDQTQTQLAFTRSGKWKLYDWTQRHARAEHIGDGTIFNADFMETFVMAGKVKEGKMVDSDAREKLPLPRDLAKSVLAAIRERRVAEGMQLGPIDQLFDCAKRGVLRWLGLGRPAEGG